MVQLVSERLRSEVLYCTPSCMRNICGSGMSMTAGSLCVELPLLVVLWLVPLWLPLLPMWL